LIELRNIKDIIQSLMDNMPFDIKLILH